MKKLKIKFIISIILLVILIIVILLIAKIKSKNKILLNNNQNNSQQSSTSVQTPSSTPNSVAPAKTIPPTATAIIAEPLSDALARITKKPFGIYVTPKSSPVSPEKFTGYHTGVDFETTPAEQNIDVAVKAVCGGKILLAKWATGYGGVVVQSCTLNGRAVTVIYGHLYINSVIPKVGDSVTAGEQIAILGQDYSQQTDGERKHLHLGIHIGTTVNILGYVQNKADLANWLDPAKIME